jgi:hypothetical protein
VLGPRSERFRRRSRRSDRGWPESPRPKSNALGVTMPGTPTFTRHGPLRPHCRRYPRHRQSQHQQDRQPPAYEAYRACSSPSFEPGREGTPRSHQMETTRRALTPRHPNSARDRTRTCTPRAAYRTIHWMSYGQAAHVRCAPPGTVSAQRHGGRGHGGGGPSSICQIVASNNEKNWNESSSSWLFS